MIRVRALVETYYEKTRMPGEEFDCEDEHGKLLTLIQKVEPIESEQPIDDAREPTIAEPQTRALSAEDQKMKERLTEPKAKGRYNRMDLRAKE